MKKAALFLIMAWLASLAGCATQEPVVQTVEVKVPVPTKPIADPELLACGHDEPQFKFYAPSSDSKDIIIREQDQSAFQQWIAGKSNCIDALQDFVR